jgi:hypothetical protein
MSALQQAMEVVALWNGFMNNRTLFDIVTLDNRYLIKKSDRTRAVIRPAMLPPTTTACPPRRSIAPSPFFPSKAQMSPPPLARVQPQESYHGAQIFGVLWVTRARSLASRADERPPQGGGSPAIVTMRLRLPSAAGSACPLERLRRDRDLNRSKLARIWLAFCS